MSKALLPIEYSVVSSSALQQFLHVAYELPSGSKVSFLHQGIHDIYLVSNGAIHLILKIFRKGWKSVDSIRAELDVLMALKQKSIEVSVPYKDREGAYIQELQYPEGTRYGVVYMYAPGTKLPQLNPDTAALFGRKLAALHAASNDMDHGALPWNYYVGNIFDSTLENVSSVISDLKVVEILRGLYFKMDAVFDSLDTDELRIGICHGDAHHENVHFKLEAGRVSFFDFDFAGNGYLLYDVGAFCHYERKREENVNAFLSGYNEVLPLSETEQRLIPFFSILMRLFHLGTRAKNADGSKNPLWPKNEVLVKLQQIENEVAQLKSLIV
jgi:Putative homoserine kinase type II (protein kinase fold)